MKKITSLAFVLLLALNFTVFGAEKIKVACVGDSITFGAKIVNKADKYPQQLGAMLGDAYDVGNFGLSGATLLYKGDKPYVKQKIYKSALAFEPSIVIIKLGTNDSKMENWKKSNKFEDNLNSFIDSFANLKTKPIIYLCTPCPAYQTGDRISEDRIVGEVIPIIEKVARDKNLVVIDLHEALSGKAEMFPDKIHPNEAGAKLIAETVKKVILAENEAK